MSGECEARLLKLQQYVPFLQRTKEYYISSPDEITKIAQLITIISSAGEQLRPETLERCEKFCRNLYSKFGREDELKIRKGSSSHNSRENSRYENPQHFRTGADHETPRSPSPEETERFSQHCIPKAIPNQRADSDLRHIPTVSRHETLNRDNYRRSPIAEHPSRPLRTEPIEIPTMPLHTGSIEGFSNQDQDYRIPYDQSIANGRQSLEERRVTYNRGSPDVPHAGTSFPKRESRFDRYGGDRSMIVGRPYEEPLHSNNQPKMINHWDSQPGRESHSRDRPHSGERDRSFQSRGPPSTGPPPARPGTRWDSSNSQHPRQNFPSSRSQDNLREPISGQHAQSNYCRNGEPPLNSRMDRTTMRHEPSHGSKNWSNRDQPTSNSHNFVRDSRDTELKSERNYRQNESTSRHGLFPYPSSSGFSVPNLPASSSLPQPGPRVPNYPSNTVSSQQLSSSTTSSQVSSQGPSRREDPRLANRSKPAPALPSQITTSSSLPNPPPPPPPPAPVPPSQPVAAPPRFSTSSMPGLTRVGDQRGNPRRPPPNKPPPSTDPPKGNAKGQTKDADVRKETQKPAPTSTGTDSTSGSSSRSQEEFVSPLDSLYSGASKSGQTGRGYGVQSYKIPKKKTPVDNSKGVLKPKPPLETDVSTVISSESSSANETASYDISNDDELKATSSTEHGKESNKDKDVLPIPLEALDPKKKLPSDDGKMTLNRFKSKTSTGVNESTSSPSSTKKTGESRVSESDSVETSITVVRNSPGVDTTVSSSGDNFTLAMSEDETTPVTPSKDLALNEQLDSGETLGKKKGRGRCSVPLEVARLREDLTDFMKGGMELGSRRCRSKSSQPVVDLESEDVDQRSEKPVRHSNNTAKRGRKLKGNAGERDVSSYSPIPPSEEGNETMDDTDSTYSSSVEPSNVTESPMEFPNPLRGKATSTRGRKRKGAASGRKGKPNTSSNDPSPEGPSSKAKKRKTPLVPTHLSLRGRRSMYEDFEPNEQIEEQDNPASDEQYFQCQKCSYLGQKIVHHYVNEHPELENPHISVPESEWETISAQRSPTVPPHYKVNNDLLKDLSWIPARPNYTNPVQCKLCAYSTCKRSELFEHVMIHALSASCTYRCSLCGLKETNFFDMLDHVTGHTGEFRYRCNYCDFRVAHRAGIKHHMSSMHESQDGLFYATNPLPEADQLWIFGFVCKSCHYVQMNEEGLERHRSFHPECGGYIKVNLITVSQDPASSGNETQQDSRAAQHPTEKEKGVFLCPALDGVRREELDEGQLTESLKLHSTSTFIETLAEKLTQPDAEQSSPVPTLENQNNCPPVVPNLAKVEAVENEKPEALRTEAEGKEEITPNAEKTPAVTEPPREEESNQQASDPPLLLTEVLLKPNVLLETTISKLVDKLGGTEIEAGPSASVEEVEDSDEVVEEEEEEEDDSFEYEDTEDDSDDESVEEQSMDEGKGEASDEPEVKAVEEMEAVVADEHLKEQVNIKEENMDVEPPTDSSMFLRIESVVSLNEMDDADSLDPITSVDYSSVTIAKNEVTFPYFASHDRPAFAARLKDENKYKQMLDPGRVKNLFKCMAYRCIFSCHSATDFKKHLEWHNNHFLKPSQDNPVTERRMLSEDEGKRKVETLTLPDFFFCSYCPLGARSSSQLVEHIESIHGTSLFQCSACFFRAKSPKIIGIHSIICHPKMKVLSFNCNRIFTSQTISEVDQLTLNDLPRYRCCVDNCGFGCILRISFIKHMSSCHAGVKQFRCRLCTKDIVCNNSDYTQFFLHMNVHEMGFFQCAFCLWGADLPTDALIHMCLHHPSMEGKLFTRSSQVPSSSKTLLKFWKSGLPHAYSQTHNIDFDTFFRELFNKVQVIERVLLPEEDIVNLPVAAISQATEELMDAPLVELEEITADDDFPIPKEPETEFHGFGEEEQAKAKKQTECIVIDSDGEDDNSASTNNDPSAKSQPNEETPESEELQEGLFGRQLYMCGNIGCDETAETASAFKDHLMVCDLARDSRLLTCRHCGKNMKQISNLIEHLRSHGVKRFLCGLCSYRANLVVQVRKHMKTLHRVSVVDEVSIGAGPGPANAENTLHALYPREMVARLKLRSRISGKKGAIKAYSCRDAKSIPMKSILPVKVKCAHCGYASNVRTNMIRHLSMHECSEASNATSSEGEEIIPRVLIPDQDPVNPVPHLETPSKGKMFDKMANLAYSSHVKEKPATKERMSSGIADDTNEKSQMPVFVPDHQRFVCGYHGCSHLTINENMLKYHLQTLHKTALFMCPHCPNDDEELSLDAFRSHLKMHGPKLFKCGHCIFYHWQQQDIEYHLTEKHPNRPPWQIIVRDPSDPEIKRLQGPNNSQGTEKGGPATPWNCSLCKQVAATAADMQAHVEANHGIKSQFKCALCPVRCNVRSEFDRHFASRHPNQDVQVLTMFYKVETNEASRESEAPQVAAGNFEPLWRKDDNRLRHIRGILLEENEIKQVDEAGVGAKTMTDDPVYGPFGAPSNGQYSCPKCTNYRVSYARDLRIHLYRELDYKKFLCSICNEGSWSRALALSHVGKQHPNSGAYIREVTSNPSLEEWVGKVVKVQTDALKAFKATAPNSSKAKKTGSVPPSPANSAPSSPIKSPVKTKKPVPAAPVVSPPSISTVPIQQKPMVITVNMDALSSIVMSPPKKNLNCLVCSFLADSEQSLEDHVVATHANENTKAGNKICLECGFKATPKQSLVNHQKKTKHSKTNDVPTTPDDTESESSSSLLTETENPVQQPKRGRTKTPNPYRCKHCNFSALTEHGMNLHWQRIHSASELPLDFECDIPAEISAAKPESAKIYYKCQLCSVQPGLYEEMREHSKALHPNSPAKIFRITSKVRIPPESPSADASKAPGPPAKMVRDEKIATPSKEITLLSPPVQIGQPPPPKLTIKPSGPTTTSNSQTVFVVAPPQLQPIPAYTCAWCNAKFQQESQVIRHHANHPNNVPLRYTCRDTPKPVSTEPSSSTPSKPELAVMEIRFGCPVCPKYFISLVGAQQHVGEHKQAWKCGHCVMLFGTPTLAFQHWKEVHPGLQGQLESIDSPSQIVERLSKGITLIRVQLNMKSLLKDKSVQPAHSQSKEPPGTVKEVKEKSSIEIPPPSQASKSTGVARKSTSTNLFLKENIKQESASPTSRDPPPAVLEGTRITQS